MSKSLNSLMNEMARTESAMSRIKPRRPHVHMKPLSEIEAFILLDDTLENLNKQYLNAKRQANDLVNLNGADDAMADIARDMEDSAWCAMQTRYLELRAERNIMARAQDMMRRRNKQIQDLKERATQRHKQKQAREFMNYLKVIKTVKEKNRTPQIFEWLMLFLILRIDMLGQNTKQRNYSNAFAIAV